MIAQHGETLPCFHAPVSPGSETEQPDLPACETFGVFESVGDGMLLLDAQRNLRYANTQASSLFQRNLDDVLGLPLLTVLPAFSRRPGSSAPGIAQWRKALDVPEDFPCFTFTLDGEACRELAVRVFPVHGRRDVAIGISLRDVTPLLQQVRCHERERLAMDLHDDIVQSLYAMILNAHGISDRYADSPQSASQVLQPVLSDLDTVIQRLRDYIGQLHQRSETARSATLPLASRIAQLVSSCSLRLNVQIPTEVEEALDLGASSDVLYCLREAISNAQRHGHATEVNVQASLDAGWVVVTVTDNGVGFLPSAGVLGDGLRNMATRANQLGGRCSIQHREGPGTRVCLAIPARVKEAGATISA